jgi:peroxiredoxin Q/BCP
MSKKSRKKSSKTTSGSPRATNKTKKKASKPRIQVQTKSAKTQRAAAGKSAKAASHKATPKRLKLSESAARPGKPATPALSEGQMAPAFSLPRDGGLVATLSDYAGKKLVLFFYPRADTPGCTKEAIDFTRLSGAFTDAGAAVLGISADPLKAQEKFRDKHKLAVPLISDEQHEMLEAYGAWGEKSMYGKKFLGILRTTVLVGNDGRVARIWRNVRVDGHADEVLVAARNL